MGEKERERKGRRVGGDREGEGVGRERGGGLEREREGGRERGRNRERGKE